MNVSKMNVSSLALVNINLISFSRLFDRELKSRILTKYTKAIFKCTNTTLKMFFRILGKILRNFRKIHEFLDIVRKFRCFIPRIRKKYFQ